ncbi:MAG: sensor histidine kinase [Chlorobiota bacterium]
MFAQANEADNYSTTLIQRYNLPGKIYPVDSEQFVVIQNNWLENTATVNIFDDKLAKKSLILNNTEIRDLYTADSNYASLVISNNRSFLTLLNDDFSVKELHLLDTISGVNDRFKINYYNDSKFIIEKNNNLYFYDIKSKVKQTITNKYIPNTYCYIDSITFYYLKSSGNNVYLVENIKHKYEKDLVRLESANNYTLSFKSNKIVVESHFSSNSKVSIFSKSLNLEAEFWVESFKDNYFIDFTKDDELSVYTISYDGEEYSVNRFDKSMSSKLDNYILPSHIISPLSLDFINNSVIAIFQNGVYSFDNRLNVEFFKPISIGTSELNSEIHVINNNIFFAFSSNTTRIYSKEENPFGPLNYYFNRTVAYYLPIILTIFIIVLLLMYKKKKELNEALLELSEDGFIFVFNKKGELVNLNKRAMSLIEIDSSVPLGRYFKYYCISEHTQSLYQLYEKIRHLKASFQQQIHIYHNNELIEFVCNASIKRRSTGSIAGYILSGTDVTEELKQQKMNNFAQLAHDMQTNLSTIKLNSEELAVIDSDAEKKKSKIIKQINILNQKVRDIVTVGRSTEVNKLRIYSKEVVLAAIEEFDMEQYPNIELNTDVEQFVFNADSQKLTRAIRNAAENSLKSMKGRENSSLIIRSYKNERYAFYEVEDNGVGMSEDVKENMLKPYFTSAGGTGLGTMIMRNAIEQHGGEIIVKSELNKGTKIIFKLPLI